jgi:serine/threonine protein kinase/peptidoglycan hydrolase-like protein with peptidoglycan-binding domain
MTEAPGQVSNVDFVALKPGQAIGRYEVLAVLGQGGFGITYRARDAQLGREVAIKEYLPAALAVRQDGTTVLPRSTAAADDFTWGRERFVAEGRTLASLQDAPAIVRVFDFLEANGTAYIVMQLLQGETLEHRIKRTGPLKPNEIDCILWPLLGGLEQVHNAGFLHRDIKPGNILMDAAGHPTLIDFGASRAAIAGRSHALTAIFTPGYAAAEQMTAAKQGPWTDIYGLAATLYHAITGRIPPSAFDRMLDDAYEPLGRMNLPDFARGLIAGIDSGLALRASDRPQTIAGWRAILAQSAAPVAEATLALGHGPAPLPPVGQAATSPTATPPPAQVSPPRKKSMASWVAAAIVVLLAAGGAVYGLMGGGKAPKPPVAIAPAIDKAAQDAQAAAEAQRLKDQEELARLRADAAAREKAEQELASRKKIEEETRQKLAAEAAEKQRQEEEVRQKADANAADRKRQEEAARQKAEAEMAAKRRADEEDRKAAEAVENALRLSLVDKQHIQVALTALGFSTNGSDGAFGPHTRDMIAAWQKARGLTPTGFLTGQQNQALLKEAAPAISRFDDEQKKLEEAKKKAEEEKAKAEAAAKAAQPATPAAPAVPAAAPPASPNVAAATPRSGPDGVWRGTMHCTPSKGGGDFTIVMQIMMSGSAGTWTRPGSGPGTVGNQSVTVRVTGQQATVSRVYSPFNQVGVYSTATLSARYDGNTISGSGPEQNSGGRHCDIMLTRAQ